MEEILCATNGYTRLCVLVLSALLAAWHPSWVVQRGWAKECARVISRVPTHVQHLRVWSTAKTKGLVCLSTPFAQTHAPQRSHCVATNLSISKDFETKWKSPQYLRNTTGAHRVESHKCRLSESALKWSTQLLTSREKRSTTFFALLRPKGEMLRTLQIYGRPPCDTLR